MARYQDLLDDVRPFASDAPEPELIDAIRRSVIEYARHSRYWREHKTIDLKRGVSTYRLSVGGGRVDQVTRAVFKSDVDCGRELKKRPHAELVAPTTVRRYNVPDCYSEPPGSGEIFVFSTDGLDVSQNPKLDVYFVAVPTRTSTSFPDFLRDQHFEGLVHGAAYQLLMLPGRSWSDPKLAEAHRRRFHQFANEGRRESMTDGWAVGRTRRKRWF